MEADVIYDFQGSEPDELACRKGQLVKIISKEEDSGWLGAELDGKEGIVPGNYVKLRPHDWFVKNITREEAESKLLCNTQGHAYPDGTFLVRNSMSSCFGEYSISVKFGTGVQHFKIMRTNGKYFLWVTKFNSINALIAYHRVWSINNNKTLLLQDTPNNKVSHHAIDPRGPAGKTQSARAIYEFKPQSVDEVGLRKGDVIRDIVDIDEHWGEGVVRGLRGLFPKTYVQFT